MVKFKLLLVLLICSTIQAQQYNSWVFGNTNYIKFNPTPTIAGVSAMSTSEGCASISDNLGNLLFYTNGVNVWNKNHIQMPNGFGLLGDVSTTQSAIIVQQPLNPTIYYIFTAPESITSNGIRYSTVDITLNSGLGDVVLKNVLLDFTGTEKLVECVHRNGVDKWILKHNSGNNTFSSHLLSNIGLGFWSVNTVGTIITNNIGSMKVSPNRDKVACCWYGQNKLCIYDFDNNTGLFSNEVTLTTDVGPYGCEFSPDGRFLYVGFNNGLKIYQIDLCNNNSKTTIASNVGAFLGQFQAGPDGKIYISQRLNTRLHVINNPNSLGLACNLVLNQTVTGGVLTFGLPNYPQDCPIPVINSFNYTLNCGLLNLTAPVIGCEYSVISYKWFINGNLLSVSPNTSVQLNNNQTYNVSLQIQLPCYLYNIGYNITTNSSGNLYSN